MFSSEQAIIQKCDRRGRELPSGYGPLGRSVHILFGTGYIHGASRDNANLFCVLLGVYINK